MFEYTTSTFLIIDLLESVLDRDNLKHMVYLFSQSLFLKADTIFRQEIKLMKRGRGHEHIKIFVNKTEYS